MVTPWQYEAHTTSTISIPQHIRQINLQRFGDSPRHLTRNVTSELRSTLEVRQGCTSGCAGEEG